MSGVASMARRAVEGLVVPFPSLSAVSALVVLVQLARLSACLPGFPRSSFRLPPSAFGLLRSRTVAARREHRCAKPSLPSLPFPFLFPAPAFPRQPALEEDGRRRKAQGARRKPRGEGEARAPGPPPAQQHQPTGPLHLRCTSRTSTLSQRN